MIRWARKFSNARCREQNASGPPIAPILGTTVAALESDGAAASDYIFLHTASVLMSPSASLWLSQ
jgi:hypothetical protein